MTGLNSLRRAITAINSGSMEEGERHLILALRDETLSPEHRALTYIWMAETRPDQAYKVNCFQKALIEDPENQTARERLNAILSSNLPSPTPAPRQTPDVPLPDTTVQTRPPATPAPNVSPRTNAFYRTVGIIDGTHGAATAFFVTPNGLLATTRYAVSGMRVVTVALEPNLHQAGQVVRSYPQFDLAFIQIGTHVSRTLTFTRIARIPDNTTLTAIAHNGKTVQGIHRVTKRDLKPHWIPTSFRQLPDAGGNPILDRSNHVVGMLTRVSSRSSNDVFGLDIHLIRARADEYLHDALLNPNKVYCTKCGERSLAGSMGGFYCEHCGGILPDAVSQQRFVVPELDRVYHENMAKFCTLCRARVGYWDGKCLRCGADVMR